jgi:hypothetical protein
MLPLSVSLLLPLLVLALVLAIDLWVYADAKDHEEQGNPVVFSIGSLTVGTAAAWFVCCLLLWILFFPLYINLR